MNKLFGLLLVAALLGTSESPALAEQRRQAEGAACTRAYLLEIADTYLAALFAHDLLKAPKAPDAKCSEQGRMIAVGGGLWRTATGISPAFKSPVPDPVAGQIGNFNPFDLEALHIFKFSGGRIHEIEAMGFSLPLYSPKGWNPFTC